MQCWRDFHHVKVGMNFINYNKLETAFSIPALQEKGMGKD